MKLLCTINHNLTDKQKSELNNMGYEIQYLHDVKPEIAEQLRNCPADENALIALSWIFVDICFDFDAVLLPVGSPAFMHLVSQNLDRSIVALFAHTERISEDIPQPDGSIKKIAKFEHVRFISLC